MNRSRWKHQYLKFFSRENYEKHEKNVVHFVKRQKQHFKKFKSKSSSNNKAILELSLTFLTTKSSLSSDSLTVKGKDKFIDDEKELGAIFNNYYIHIVGKTSGKPV